MKKNGQKSNVLTYLQQHWFKVACLTLVLYLLIQKDFRFSINMNSPTEGEYMEMPSEGEYIEMPSEGNDFQTAPKKEIFTERKSEKTKMLDKFELPSIFGSSPKYNPMVDLEKLDDKVKHDYLKRFARVVINERHKYGIPSSIILACGLLQSQAGQRDIAQKGNNHFGLTCTVDWSGESGAYQGDCYRHYENAWTSFRDHSNYLTSGKFAQLTTLESTDYRAWANGLEQLGYSEVDNLADHLINVIETYGLADLDRR